MTGGRPDRRTPRAVRHLATVLRSFRRRAVPKWVRPVLSTGLGATPAARLGHCSFLDVASEFLLSFFFGGCWPFSSSSSWSSPSSLSSPPSVRPTTGDFVSSPVDVLFLVERAFFRQQKNDACDATRGRPIELIRSARNETKRTTTTTTTRNEIKVTKRRRPQTSLCAKRRGTDNRRLGRRRLLFCFFLLLRLLFFPFDSPAPSTRNFHSKYENGGGCWRVSISLWRSPLSSVLVCVCVSVCVCVC